MPSDEALARRIMLSAAEAGVSDDEVDGSAMLNAPMNAPRGAAPLLAGGPRSLAALMASAAGKLARASSSLERARTSSEEAAARAESFAATAAAMRSRAEVAYARLNDTRALRSAASAAARTAPGPASELGAALATLVDLLRAPAPAAVEVHQASVDSSDLNFDLALIGERLVP